MHNEGGTRQFSRIRTSADHPGKSPRSGEGGSREKGRKVGNHDSGDAITACAGC